MFRREAVPSSTNNRSTLIVTAKQSIANRGGGDAVISDGVADALEAEEQSDCRGHLGLDGQLKAVIGREHFGFSAAPADRLEPLRLSEDAVEHPVV